MAHAIIDLNGTYTETGPFARGLGAAEPGPHVRLDRILEQVDRIVRKSRIKTVVIHRSEKFSAPSLGALEGIRLALMQLRQAERHLVYYAADYSFDDLYLSSVCTTRIIHRLGTVSFLGRAMSRLYFAQLLSRHGISVDVIRHGKYKSAMTPLTEERVDSFDREQLEHILNLMVDRVRTIVGTEVIPSGTALDALLAGQIVDAQSAVEKGWMERIDDLQGIKDSLRDEKSRPAKSRRAKGRIGASGPRVALYFFDGAIDHGTNRRSPLLGRVVGSDWYVEQLKKVRDDTSTQALVLRVNSPGGSASASEDIRREILRIREKKPVIVSMGPVAASGGYWISTSASRIFAHKFTVTGSIGVITGLFLLRDFLARRGITASVLRSGDHADLGSALREMTAEERRIFEEQIDRIYDEFVQIVSTSREMDAEAVREVSGGRVWTGEDAMERGLVDELGDIRAALDYTADALGVSSVQVRFGPVVRRPLVERLLAGRMPSTVDPLALMRHLGDREPEDHSAAEGATSGTNGMLFAPALVGVARECLHLSGRPLALWTGGITPYYSTATDPEGSSKTSSERMR